MESGTSGEAPGEAKCPSVPVFWEKGPLNGKPDFDFFPNGWPELKSSIIVKVRNILLNSIKNQLTSCKIIDTDFIHLYSEGAPYRIKSANPYLR